VNTALAAMPLRRLFSMPAVPPTLLHTLLLYGLLLFEQKAPVYILLLEQKAPIYIAVRVPPAGSRRQTLSSRLI
jgi:hypothetical protein